jgi:hypothetical protein
MNLGFCCLTILCGRVKLSKRNNLACTYNNAKNDNSPMSAAIVPESCLMLKSLGDNCHVKPTKRQRLSHSSTALPKAHLTGPVQLESMSNRGQVVELQAEKDIRVTEQD